VLDRDARDDAAPGDETEDERGRDADIGNDASEMRWGCLTGFFVEGGGVGSCAAEASE
jgi:hypothetical protein